MKLVMNVPDYIKEQADDGNAVKFGIPVWLAFEIAYGTPLPKGHGRLIDADALLEKQYCIDDSETLSTRNIVNVEDVEDAPTIIEADNGESEE